MTNEFIATAKKQIKDSLKSDIEMIKKSTDFSEWQIKGFITAKNFGNYTKAEKVAYLIKRATLKANAKETELLRHVELLKDAKQIENFSISVEWKKNSTWGANPTAEIRVCYTDSCCEHFTGTASGCGYDKESAAIASAFNQCNSLIALLFKVEKKDPEGKVYGYSNSKNGFFPHLSGGVGTSCYPAIFALAGFKMQKVGSGKMFDSWAVNKK